MNNAASNLPPGFDGLSADEKLDYVQNLWDHISADSEKVSVPEWHRNVIAERLAEYRANPDDGEVWDEVRDELLEELAR